LNRFLLDVNTLLALLDPQHIFHAAAHRWVEETPDLVWLTCPLVQNGALRVASQAAYPNPFGAAADVWEILRLFCEDERHEFCPDDISLMDPRQLARPELLTASRVTDLYLLALARKHGVRLATFDRKLPADSVPGGRDHLFAIEA
jgi:uncharacterized protein